MEERREDFCAPYQAFGKGHVLHYSICLRFVFILYGIEHQNIQGSQICLFQQILQGILGVPARFQRSAFRKKNPCLFVLISFAHIPALCAKLQSKDKSEVLHQDKLSWINEQAGWESKLIMRLNT